MWLCELTNTLLKGLHGMSAAVQSFHGYAAAVLAMQCLRERSSCPAPILLLSTVHGRNPGKQADWLNSRQCTGYLSEGEDGVGRGR